MSEPLLTRFLYTFTVSAHQRRLCRQRGSSGLREPRYATSCMNQEEGITIHVHLIIPSLSLTGFRVSFTPIPGYNWENISVIPGLVPHENIGARAN